MCFIFQYFLFALSWDVPARSWRYALGFSWSMARYFCFFLWHIEFQHALDTTFLAPALTLSWCYALNLVLEQSKMLLTLRSTTIVMIRSYNFSWNFQRALVGATLRLLTLRSGESHALPATLLALFWNTPGRSSCYALLFFLRHSSMRLMLRSDLQHVLDARLLGFSWSFNTLSWYCSLRCFLELPTRSWCYALDFLLELPAFSWC